MYINRYVIRVRENVLIWWESGTSPQTPV